MVQTTNHAELRHRQCIDPSESFPKERIRELWERAEIDLSIDVTEGTPHVVDDAILVAKGEKRPTITTILRRGRSEWP